MVQAQTMATMRANKEATLDVVTFFDDFLSFRHFIDSTGTGIGDNDFYDFGWIVTMVGSSQDTSVQIIDEMNGILKLTPAASDNDGAGFQWNAEIFDCDTNVTTGYRGWTVGMDVKLGEATESDFMGGLSITDTDLTDGSSDGVWFYKTDAQDTIFCTVVKNTVGDTTQTNSVFVDSVWNRFDIDFNGRNRITFRIDNVVVATHTSTAYFPNDEELTPTFGFWNGQSVAEVFWIDWYYSQQVRKEH